MTSTSSQSTIAYLNYITRELNRYIPLAFLVLGTVGNILNILVFRRPSLRANVCSLYFVSSSVVNFLSLYIGLLTPFLGLYNLDPTQSQPALCKIRFYLRYSSITLSTWFILLACFDRYLSTSSDVRLRRWSSLRFAKRIIFIATVVAFTIPYTQVFYCYTVNQRQVCTTSNTMCKLFNDILLLCCNSGLPPLLMVIVSMLTIRNVKNSTRLANGSRRDVQLIRILFIQVSILVLFAVPVAVQKFYTSSTAFVVKDPLNTAIDSLVNQISIEVSYISNSITFYIYSLTSKKYRKEVIELLFPCYRHRHDSVVHPAQQREATGREAGSKAPNNLPYSKTQAHTKGNEPLTVQLTHKGLLST